MGRIEADSLTLIWRCKLCQSKCAQELLAIVEQGTAICEQCGEDMQLEYVLMDEKKAI